MVSVRANVLLLGMIAIGIALGVGCTTENQPVAADANAPVENAPVEVTVGDEKAFADTLAKHQGKVVIVDFWATWCHSCVEHFPQTVELQDKFAEQGLAAVAVSFDELENGPNVKFFLEKHDAGRIDNLQSSYDGVGTQVTTAFDFEGILPHYRLYDRTGKLRYRWDEPPADLEEKIQELLAEKPESAS
jgi:thiol-disulfide isomerase/thioredoxin